MPNIWKNDERKPEPLLSTDKRNGPNHTHGQTMVGYHLFRITNSIRVNWRRYPKFQDRYESLIEQEAPTSQAYQQESQSPAEAEKEESKWDSKMDDYDEESREYYQEHKANYGDPLIK